jgi:hypothetical protein
MKKAEADYYAALGHDVIWEDAADEAQALEARS